MSESCEIIAPEPEYLNAFRIKFYARVDKHGPVPSHVPEIGNCWIWKGIKKDSGYGMFYAPFLGTKNKQGTTHRASWVIEFGNIPKGQGVLHKCDNPACVRPSHLFLGDNLANMTDMHSKGRGSFKKGHIPPCAKLTKENVIEIRRRVAMGEPQLSIAQSFGIARNNVSTIKHRKSWRHV